MNLLKHIKLTFALKKMGLSSAFEFRTSSIIQLVGMIINDTFFILLWFLFFEQFTEVNGWGLNDMFLLLSINTMAYGLCFFFFAGIFGISKMIQDGEIDNYLTLPPNPLLNIAAGRTHPSDIGDFIFGFILFFFTGDISPDKILTSFSVVVFASMILFSFTVITQTLGFYIDNFEEAATELFHSLLGLTLYPQNAYFGILKVLVLTILPAFWVAGLPISLIKNFDTELFVILGAIAIFSCVFAFYFFKLGLKKYESGNLIGLNR